MLSDEIDSVAKNGRQLSRIDKFLRVKWRSLHVNLCE